MMKKLSVILAGSILLVAVAGSTLAAKSVTCTVTSIEDDKVILDCGSKAKKLATGTTVIVKTKIDGC